MILTPNSADTEYLTACDNQQIMTKTAEHPLVLFDGVCNLCESTVLFIIRRDRRAMFRFASLQSSVAGDLLSKYHYSADTLSSVLLIADDQLFRKAEAGLQIVKRLDGAWPVLYYLFCWVPRFIADPIYDFIGKRRYRWFGMKDECWIPTAELRQRFIDDPANTG
jgi:predicted DCC family thiol-disulfide oxidoreductase YuxK